MKWIEAETDVETLYSYTLKRSDGAVWRWPDRLAKT
jgi:hypothetical protein